MLSRNSLSAWLKPTCTCVYNGGVTHMSSCNNTHGARILCSRAPPLCAQKLRNRSCGGAREATRRERHAPPVAPGQGPRCARATHLRSSRSCLGRGPRSASRSISAGLAGWPLGAHPPAGPARPACAAPFAAPRMCARPAAAAPSGTAAAGALSLAPAASGACARPASSSPLKQASCSATPSIDTPDSLRSRLRPPGAERCLHEKSVSHTGCKWQNLAGVTSKQADRGFTPSCDKH